MSVIDTPSTPVLLDTHTIRAIRVTLLSGMPKLTLLGDTEHELVLRQVNHGAVMNEDDKEAEST